MSNEQLLAQAREKYPIGTKFKGMITGKEYTSISLPEFENLENEHYFSIVVKTKEGNDTNIGVYYDGHWAEIVSTPVPDWQPKEGEMVIIVKNWNPSVHPTKLTENSLDGKLATFVRYNEIDDHLINSYIDTNYPYWVNLDDDLILVHQIAPITSNEATPIVEPTHPDKICPIDMPSVGVKKGDKFTYDNKHNLYFTVCFEGRVYIPLELVQTWENVPTEDDMWRDVWNRSCESVDWFFKYVQSNYNISRK